MIKSLILFLFICIACNADKPDAGVYKDSSGSKDSLYLITKYMVNKNERHIVESVYKDKDEKIYKRVAYDTQRDSVTYIYTYDHKGLLMEINTIEPSPHKTSYIYNTNGRKICEIDSDTSGYIYSIKPFAIKDYSKMTIYPDNDVFIESSGTEHKNLRYSISGGTLALRKDDSFYSVIRQSAGSSDSIVYYYNSKKVFLEKKTYITGENAVLDKYVYPESFWQFDSTVISNINNQPVYEKNYFKNSPSLALTKYSYTSGIISKIEKWNEVNRDSIEVQPPDYWYEYVYKKYTE